MSRRSLNYTGASQSFMQNLLNQGNSDTGWAIKSHLLELCEFGQNFTDLEKKGDTANLFLSPCKAAPADKVYQGFTLEVLILEKVVIVVSITSHLAWSTKKKRYFYRFFLSTFSLNPLA